MKSRLILLIVALLVLSGCGMPGGALRPVRGTVRVNSQPAERVVITFHRVASDVHGNAAHPCAVTDASGAFQISTNKDGDGAVPGEYLASFTWASNPDPDLARDLLGGTYDESKPSKFRINVLADGETELTPFELTADPSQVREFVK